MKKNLKVGLIIATIVLVPLGTLALFLLIPKKSSKDEVDANTNTGSKEVSNPEDSFPLKVGSKGDLVKELQTKLNVVLGKLDPRPPYVPYYNGKQLTSLAVDGDFGGRTLSVVKFHFGTAEVTNKQLQTL